jgi:uncharacterized membrane protein
VVALHLYLGALVFGAVLLAVSLLVDDGSPVRLASLRSAAVALAGFGIVAVALEALGATASPVFVLALALVIGLSCALAVWLLGRRESER